MTSTDLVGFAPDELQKEVGATSSPHRAAFFQLTPQESVQPVMGTYDVLEAIAQRIPTYCVHRPLPRSRHRRGGSYTVTNAQQVMGGELAARVLSGEKPGSHSSHQW